MPQGLRTLSVDDAERFTKDYFSERHSKGTHDFWTSVLFLVTVFWSGALRLGFVGDRLPIASNLGRAFTPSFVRESLSFCDFEYAAEVGGSERQYLRSRDC